MNLFNKLFKKRDPILCEKCKTGTLMGNELIFISTILRDGSGTHDLSTTDMSHLDEDEFTIRCLSMTSKTYTASGFNTYVVKLKNK